MGNMRARSLKLYLTNINAHNEALGFGWNRSTFNAIIKEILNKKALHPELNVASPHGYDQGSFDACYFLNGINSQYYNEDSQLDTNYLANYISYASDINYDPLPFGANSYQLGYILPNSNIPSEGSFFDSYSQQICSNSDVAINQFNVLNNDNI
ncbi:7001_t:CDS:2, partial [Racocetra persica]